MPKPAPPSSRTILTDDGVSIAYKIAGPVDGPAVAMCHGICASGEQFAADAAYFAWHGYRVIVPDLRAHGRSGAPDEDDGDFSLARLAADMRLVLHDAAVQQVHWLGNSLGGIVGLAMLAATPDLFASFATFGTAYRLDLPSLAPTALPMAYKLFGARRLGRLTAAMTTDNAAARTLISDTIAAFDPMAGRRIAAAITSYDFIAEAQAYAGPILLIRAGRDRAVNLALRHTLQAMSGRPNFERIDIQDAGHCANLDAPDEVRAALALFWQRAGAHPVGSEDSLPVDV